jgi:hypothetical protein
LSATLTSVVIKPNKQGLLARQGKSFMKKQGNNKISNISQASRQGSGEGRTAYFLDVDNLCQSGLAPKHMVEASLMAIRMRFQPNETDQIFCAATAKAAFFCKQYWPKCSVRVGRGADGSDLRLLNDADPVWLSKRFNRVVIASADGIFAGLATELQKLGVKVVIAVSSQKVSHKLRAVAPVVVLSISAPSQYVLRSQFNLLAKEAK